MNSQPVIGNSQPVIGEACEDCNEEDCVFSCEDCGDDFCLHHAMEHICQTDARTADRGGRARRPSFGEPAHVGTSAASGAITVTCESPGCGPRCPARIASRALAALRAAPAGEMVRRQDVARLRRVQSVLERLEWRGGQSFGNVVCPDCSRIRAPDVEPVHLPGCKLGPLVKDVADWLRDLADPDSAGDAGTGEP